MSQMHANENPEYRGGGGAKLTGGTCPFCGDAYDHSVAFHLRFTGCQEAP